MALQTTSTAIKPLTPSDSHAITLSLNPKSTKFEFGGPLGALAVTLATPLTIYGLHLTCSELTGGCPPPLLSMPSTLLSPRWWNALWDTKAFLAYCGWYTYCFLCWKYLPGDWVEGPMLRNGKKKSYKINAFATLLLSLGLAGGTILGSGPLSFMYIYENWLPLVTSSVIMAVVQAIWCYRVSFQDNKLLALGGNTGNTIYDFFIGRELNPGTPYLDSINFDLKVFNELRPGLILWVLNNLSCACEQMVRRGRHSYPTDSMILINLFQFLYVADALFNESAILSTMDVTTDGFGFMLAIGDLAWVPFVYSLQARYLAFKPYVLGNFWSGVVVGLQLLGYYIFRVSNAEKDNFRKGGNPKGLSSMKTSRGTELITSGWWGRSRHPNYFGDLIMALSWCMTTGFDTPITYFYFFYFTGLLVHRQMRDDEACEKKYGADWEKYKKIVKYRIVPYIY